MKTLQSFIKGVCDASPQGVSSYRLTTGWFGDVTPIDQQAVLTAADKLKQKGIITDAEERKHNPIFKTA